MTTRRPFSLGLLASASLALAGCGSLADLAAALGGPRQRAVAPEWRSLVLAASADANARSPVAVDLVFVKDPALVDMVAAMPAPKWFAGRLDLQRTFPQGLDVLAYEVVPRQSLALARPTLSAQRATAVFVFAGYATPGEHRARLGLQADGYLVELGARGFEVRDLTASARK